MSDIQEWITDVKREMPVHKYTALLQRCWNLIPDLACVWYTQPLYTGGTMDHYCQIFTEQV